MSTIQTTTTDTSATASAARLSTSRRASRYAGIAALAIRGAFRTWAARKAPGSSSAPKNGASRSGYSWLIVPMTWPCTTGNGECLVAAESASFT